MKDITQAALLLSQLKSLVESLSTQDRVAVIGTVRAFSDCASAKERELAALGARPCCA